MAEPRTRRDEIVAAALELLEEQGPDGVTMRAVAARVGIRAPSLYKHVPDKDDLETLLMGEAFRRQAAAFADAAADSSDPLGAIARVYRRWATEHPHLYRLMTHKPLPRERLPEGVEEAAARPLVEAVGGDRDLARAAWALAHGLTSLELAGRFPADADVDAAWRAGVDALNGAASRRG